VNNRIVVDWDGVLVEEKWPEMGDWLPGAVEGLKELDKLGEVVIHTCRVANVEPGEEDVERPAYLVAMEWRKLQKKLEEVGLGHLEVWRRPYKPPALIYIDDRAHWFNTDKPEWDYVIEDVKWRLAQQKNPPFTTNLDPRFYSHNRDPGDETTSEATLVNRDETLDHKLKRERELLLAEFTKMLELPTGDGSKKRRSGKKDPWWHDQSHERSVFSHIARWKRSEVLDPDSGAHPLVHAAWRCLALAYQETHGRVPPGTGMFDFPM
jgi:hypothetical protein